MKTVRTLFITFLLSTALALTAGMEKPKMTQPKQAVAAKIAFINISAILPMEDKPAAKSSDEWREIVDKLKETLEPVDEELQQLEQSFGKIRQEFEKLKNSGMSSQEALGKKVQELQALDGQIRQKYGRREELMQKELRAAQEIIGPKLDKIINDLRQEEGWDLILRSEALLAGDKSFDRTEKVTEILNKNYAQDKAKKADKEKAPAASSKPKVV